MPYEAKKLKCKKKDGSSGSHAIYMKGTNEKVGCTSDPKKYMAALYSVEENTMAVSKEQLQEIIKEELATFLSEEKDWIQGAEKDIEKRGTEGVCTGDKFGGPSCPPGSKRYNLAKTFRKMAKARKSESLTKTMNENVVDITSLEDLANLFAMRSQGGTVARFDPAEANAAIALLTPALEEA